jgi:hypothetical protein
MNGGGSEGHLILHDMCTQQLEALNVKVELSLPSPNSLFLQPMVHLENQSKPSSKYNNKNFSSGSKLDLNLTQG